MSHARRAASRTPWTTLRDAARPGRTTPHATRALAEPAAPHRRRDVRRGARLVMSGVAVAALASGTAVAMTHVGNIRKQHAAPAVTTAADRTADRATRSEERTPTAVSSAAPSLTPSAAPSATPKASATASTQGAVPVSTSGRWQPKAGESFVIQYTGTVDLNRPAKVYNLDWENTTAAQVQQLHSRGVHVICYLSAGSSENWRRDDAKFPASVKGEALDGWPGENWLDVRRTATLMPIMAARMDVCKQKGFDAIDPDNTDGWSQQTGFAITKADQVTYQRALADAAHQRGLAIGLKNDVEQVSQMADIVDFAVNEQCHEYGECGAYSSFLASGKPVYNVEYAGGCPTGRPAGMSSYVAKLELGPGGTIC
ncbi:endo alpha-1,4 polygalactosaminidase [Raineyella sp.]|uniref:endo alpha-1,4 polygalactosaminidase n=1 Tax=Raineyella sp. TaxID=1911550 RepID=UPI002B1F7BAE|nr:endo alpha-1,4 polygalactosaminidase [Raineyella sp.]MEA5153237.1 endo alpha-1,4 polygalactosaminidase [Raineyella sp.]